MYKVDVNKIFMSIIAFLLNYFSSDKFGERRNIPKLSENTIITVTAK